MTQMFNMYGKDNMLLVKRSNIPQPVRNLLVILSAIPTETIYARWMDRPEEEIKENEE